MPILTITKDAFVIRIPRFFGWRKKNQAKQTIVNTGKRPFEDLVGVLKDVPEFKGKTSVEVQHETTRLWAQKNF